MDGWVDRITERRPYNAVSDFVDAHITQGRANKVAFVDPERSLTYGELQARSIRFANALRDLGIVHEQRIALLLNDTVDYPVAFWGAIRAGCVAIPLNVYLTLPQYAYILADCRARVLVVDARLAETYRAGAGQAAAAAGAHCCRRHGRRNIVMAALVTASRVYPTCGTY